MENRLRAFPSRENVCLTLIQGSDWGIEAKIKKFGFLPRKRRF
jgi:hypothetical protein